MTNTPPENAAHHEYIHDHRCVRIIDGKVCYQGKDDPVHQPPQDSATTQTSEGETPLASARKGDDVLDPARIGSTRDPAPGSGPARPDTAAAPTSQLIASNVGPDRYWRLRIWAAATAKALGCASATLVGSALHGKDWRDLDVRFTFAEPEAWNRVAAAYSGDSWWALCAGLSAHGTSVVGAQVDAQITKPQDGFRLWEAAA